MNSLSIDEYRPLNRWDNCFIQPGKVGSVGDVVMGVRLRHSAPDTPLRYDNFFSHANMIANGANVTDGQGEGYAGGGGPARVVDSNSRIAVPECNNKGTLCMLYGEDIVNTTVVFVSLEGV